MAGDWTAEALEQLEWHWNAQLRPRLVGLTDDEFVWEPAPGCWSIRPRGEATTPMAAGKGDYVIDFELPPPNPAPITTIAWRLAHITAGCFGNRTSNHFGEMYPSIRERFAGAWWETWDIPGTAAGMLADLDEVHAAWIAGLRTLDKDTVWNPVGELEGAFSDAPYASLILHINREVIHHGAEIALLRDLYRVRVG
jgi:hypothetical protein